MTESQAGSAGLQGPTIASAIIAKLAGQRLVRWAIAFAMGAFCVLAFAPFFITPAFALGICILFLLICSAPTRLTAFADGWFFGFGFFGVGLFWIAESFANQPAIPDIAGPPAVILLGAVMALYPAIAAWASRLFSLQGIKALIAFCLMFSATEWLRGHLFTGFPWNLTAAIWAGSPIMMQPLSIMGAYGVGLLTLLVFASPVLAVPGIGGRHGWRWPLLGLFVLGIWAGLGAWRLSTEPTRFVDDVTVRLVQANISQKQKWHPGLQRQHFADYLSLSESLSFPESRLLVLWPETAITDYFFDREQGRRAIIGHMLPDNALLFTGAPRVLIDDKGNRSVANSLMALNSDGDIIARYDKHHLVPFGEYLPARRLLSLIGLSKLTQGNIDFHAGPGIATLQIPGLGTISPLICYEVIFPGSVARDDNRPQALINITNDAWFGQSIGPHQHLALSRMRAVEEGIPLIRSAGTGISAVIDPTGRLLNKISLNQRGVLDTSLPASIAEPTFYSQWGDGLFSLFFLICTLLLRIRPFARTKSV